jgi:hypothetical protein
VLVSQGLAAPSLAVLGPRGVARLLPVCDAPFLSHGLAGAGRPRHSRFLQKFVRSNGPSLFSCAGVRPMKEYCRGSKCGR